MSLNHALLGQLAAAINIIGFLPYLISIFKGKTKPNRATYLIWFVVNSITFLSYAASGAHDTLWILGSYIVIALIIFILSLSKGVGGTNTLDLFCIASALFGLILWFITKNPLTALYLNIGIEFLGFVPTIKKSYLLPKTEDTLAWNLALVGSFVNLFAIEKWDFHIYLYPIFVLVMDILVSTLLLFPKVRFKLKK